MSLIASSSAPTASIGLSMWASRPSLELEPPYSSELATMRRAHGKRHGTLMVLAPSSK
jgi:hypothetical protein